MSTFQVQVSWDGAAVPGVRAVGPLGRSVGVVTFYDGALGTVYKVPGRPDTQPVTLEREVDDDLSFDVWASGPSLRKRVDLTLTDASTGITVDYRLDGCWVSGYSVNADVETGRPSSPSR